jgi:serine/threonine protein kinase/WD40 repeat protein
MALASGAKLGPYEIQSQLGEGGMGEVYRARDTRLDRTVAIKILASHLSSSPELKQRMEREARAISALNHPNICHLYDIGSENGTDYLVMEFLEGETLADRLHKGALPLSEIYRIGIAISEALAVAHRAGIVHRDLKPANIMLTKSGAKLMDFGLAKPTSGGTPGSSAAPLLSAARTMSGPTPVSPLTTAGSIVGTIQYMCPEQIEGKEADARSDIFALGAVLYEMASGKRAFEGKSQISVASAILEKDPEPISAVQPTSPAGLDHLIRTCLAKDPEERFQTAQDVKLQLKWISQGGSSQTGIPPTIPSRTKRPNWMTWAVASLIALVMLGAGWFLHLPVEQPVLRSNIVLPPKLRLDSVNTAIALSPDGKKIVMAAAGEGGKQQLYLRSLDALTVQPIQGTEEATYPFWAPDGSYIGFFTPGKLKKVALSSGAVQTICDAVDGRGATWSKQGTIVFAPAGDSPLFSVPDSGGTPMQLSTPERPGLSHRHPQFLPDGKHVLYFGEAPGATKTAVYVVNIDDKKSQFITASQARAQYVEPGYLLYMRERSLLAQPFSTSSLKLSGRAVPIAQQVQFGPVRWTSNYTASADSLLYESEEGGGLWQLSWFDVNGKELEKVGEPRELTSISVAPDGKRAAAVVAEQNGGQTSLWVYDLPRAVASRFSFDSGDADDPVWSPDSRQLAYSFDSSAGWKILTRAANGTGAPQELLSSDLTLHPVAWSPDGRFIAYNATNPSNKKFEVWMLPVSGDRKPFMFQKAEAQVRGMTFSSDGRWFVYVSDESGRDEIYMTPFPGPGEKHQVSPHGGYAAWWYGRKGMADEGIAYADPANTTINLIRITEKNDALEFGQPRPLFGARSFVDANSGSFSPDFKKMLVSLSTKSEGANSLVMVNNWRSELSK